jgi:hypothetical protein
VNGADNLLDNVDINTISNNSTTTVTANSVNSTTTDTPTGKLTVTELKYESITASIHEFKSSSSLDLPKLRLYSQKLISGNDNNNNNENNDNDNTFTTKNKKLFVIIQSNHVCTSLIKYNYSNQDCH